MNTGDTYVDLQIFGVVGEEIDGKWVMIVSLAGGPSNACGTIKFIYADGDLYDVALKKATKWKNEGALVKLVKKDIHTHRPMLVRQYSTP